MLKVGLFVIALLVSAGARAQCALPYTITNGQPPDATKVMANFNALVSCLSVGGSSNAVQYNGGSGALAGAGPLTNGQLLIGSTGNPPQPQTLTAGAGITITNGTGNIKVEATPYTPATGLYRQVMSALPTVSATGLQYWINQGAATLSEGAAGVSISAPSGVDALIARIGVAPSAPYTLTALIGATRNSTGFSEVGIGWSDGAKFHILSYVVGGSGGTPPTLQVVKWSSPTVRVGTDFSSSAVSYFPQPIWMQLKDDGTNVSFNFSQDGANFLTLFTVAKSSSYLGSLGYGNFILFVNPRGGQTIGTAMSWAIN